MLATEARSLRATRWTAQAPRIALTVACALLSLVGLRSLVSTPTAAPPARPTQFVPDGGSQAFAEAFARAYLTWDGETRDLAPSLEPFGADLVPPRPASGLRQTVGWTTVAAVKRAGARTEVITVVAQTSRGRIALAVTVLRERNGTRQVVREPAVVGALPRSTRSKPDPNREADEPGLPEVVERALRNYLSRDGDDLRADLASSAAVVLPDRSFEVAAIDAVVWARVGSRVATTVRVADRDGVEMTLRYELTVAKQAGRWLVREIQTNPEVQ